MHAYKMKTRINYPAHQIANLLLMRTHIQAPHSIVKNPTAHIPYSKHALGAIHIQQNSVRKPTQAYEYFTCGPTRVVKRVQRTTLIPFTCQITATRGGRAPQFFTIIIRNYSIYTLDHNHSQRQSILLFRIENNSNINHLSIQAYTYMHAYKLYPRIRFTTKYYMHAGQHRTGNTRKEAAEQVLLVGKDRTAGVLQLELHYTWGQQGVVDTGREEEGGEQLRNRCNYHCWYYYCCCFYLELTTDGILRMQAWGRHR
eukprot:TRINITY_DN8323_c0_g1_i4.p1 TRINITY_DN8323_c0_g1~~TRINITY_DN8323_c0_g1_i4.p1  ORF type:complete len:256 (+),score=-12.90 TRINITY_DN8323_c0_g1_i4:4625-5392(+)